MKTNFFLLPALAALALTACNRVPDPTIDPMETGIPAVLQIKLADTPTNSKASGAPTEATETSVKKGMIFVFKGTNSNPALDAKKEFDFTSTNVVPVRVDITQGIRQVYVVANINPADFTNINTLSDLQHRSNRLSLNAFRTSGSLPMSGYTLNVDASTGTTASPTAVSVPLTFIGSRIHVDWDISNLNAGITGLVINGVAILNVNAQSEYIASPNGSGGYNPLTHSLYDFLQGVGSTTALPAGGYLPATGTNNYDVELFVPEANKGFANNYTYVFENSSSTPIIVAFKGTYNSTTYYWPVVINGALNGIGGANTGDQSASVRRGTIYKVKAVIKGLGNENPYAPINPGAIDVTIIPATWVATISIDQEFK